MSKTAINTDEWMGLKQAYQQEVASYFRSFHRERQSHERVNPDSVAEVDRQFRERVKSLREDYAVALKVIGSI